MAPYRERVRIARDFFDEVEEQNFARTGRRGDAQGPQGNPSMNLRKTLRNHVRAVDVRTANWTKLNVPRSVQDTMVSTLQHTISFFILIIIILMRS